MVPKIQGAPLKGSAYKPLRQQAHLMLKRMSAAAERPLDFNTGIAEIYKLLNIFDSAKTDPKAEDERAAVREVLEILDKVIAPLAPFLGEEFHEMLGGKGSVFRSPWPVFDAAAAKGDTIEIPVQINGKLKAKFTAPADSSQDQLKSMALALPELAGVTHKKVIVVPGKLVNVVV
jgi:leucyl-tRNA synthetase